jgi:hypothetical protein
LRVLGGLLDRLLGVPGGDRPDGVPETVSSFFRYSVPGYLPSFLLEVCAVVPVTVAAGAVMLSS